MFPDSDINQDMNIKRTKFNEMMKSLGKAVSEDLAKKQMNKFSIIIVETTDISTMKCLAVLVKYFGEEDRQIKVTCLTS